MKNYKELCKKLLYFGNMDDNRTQQPAIFQFGHMMRWDTAQDFPLLDLRKLHTKSIIEELLFFLRGETDTKKLSAKGVRIWDANTSREALDQTGFNDYPEGEMGPGYGFQWRNFGGEFVVWRDALKQRFVSKDRDGVDQLAGAIELLHTSPESRRNVVSAWNPQQLDRMVLPPCHMMFQFRANAGRLHLAWYQRSCDVPLGIPFNMASYGMLLHIVAKITGLEPGELVFFGGDCHIYANQIEPMETVISRDRQSTVKLNIKRELKSLQDAEKLTVEDFEFEGYNPHPPVKIPFSV